MFMAFDIPQSERELFYSPMGHSKHMNREIQEVTIIGKSLMDLDKGMSKSAMTGKRNKEEEIENKDRQEYSTL